MRSVTAECSPSLALVKYWGKQPDGVNIAATPSIAVTLEGLRTTTNVSWSDSGVDRCTIGGDEHDAAAFAPVIDVFRRRAAIDRRVTISSTNSFPTAAGIASSSSGFAALTLALDALFETRMTDRELSSTARIGSGSACRAVFGGFTVWEADAEYALPLLPATHWPELRVLVVVVASAPKPVSSRAGMGHSRETSPVYPAWLAAAPAIYARARAALEARDLDELGTAMRESYLLMFSSMFTARPPFIYWQPESVAVIHEAERLRGDGIPAWETMDAGPQVKIVTTSLHQERVIERIRSVVPDARIICASPGGVPRVTIDAGGAGVGPGRRD